MLIDLEDWLDLGSEPEESEEKESEESHDDHEHEEDQPCCCQPMQMMCNSTCGCDEDEDHSESKPVNHDNDELVALEAADHLVEAMVEADEVEKKDASDAKEEVFEEVMEAVETDPNFIEELP